jgi:hypothetical protein
MLLVDSSVKIRIDGRDEMRLTRLYSWELVWMLGDKFGSGIMIIC